MLNDVKTLSFFEMNSFEQPVEQLARVGVLKEPVRFFGQVVSGFTKV